MKNASYSQVLFIGNWYDQINNIKAKFPRITDADVYYDEGKKDEMLNRVQIKLGKTKEELEFILTSF